jgi:hypothetical protein
MPRQFWNAGDAVLGRGVCTSVFTAAGHEAGAAPPAQWGRTMQWGMEF